MSDEQVANVSVAANSAVETQPAQSTNVEPRQVLPKTNVATEASKPDFALPDAYKDKGWAKNIKSLEDLVKAHDNAQSLIGKKTIGVPEDWSDEKQREDFLSKVRPKSADEYALETKPEIKDLCHKYGLSKYQAEGLAKGLQAVTEVEFSKDGLEKEISAIFGKDTESAAKSAQYIKQVLGDEVAILETLTNKQLSVVYKLGLQGIKSMPVEGVGALQGHESANVRAPEAILKDLQALDNQPNWWQKKPALLEELRKSQQANKRSK